MNKPRKIAKYPELWYDEVTDEMMVIYPYNKAEMKGYGSKKWFVLGNGLYLPWPKLMRSKSEKGLLFLGELK